MSGSSESVRVSVNSKRSTLRSQSVRDSGVRVHLSLSLSSPSDSLVKMLTLTVKPRSSKPSNKFPLTVKLSQSTPTVSDLKKSIQQSTRVCNSPLPLPSAATDQSEV